MQNLSQDATSVAVSSNGEVFVLNQQAGLDNIRLQVAHLLTGNP